MLAQVAAGLPFNRDDLFRTGCERLDVRARTAFGDITIRRATTDGFFLAIEAADPRFELARTERLLVSVRATRVSPIED